MAFFVPESKEPSKSNTKESERLEISLLALGKKVGLSFTEINELRSIDLIDLAKSFSGSEDSKPKEATQDDIDRFFG